jgi:cation diffusion facilitator CzcD-associated flavoprotein CzcO
VTYEHHGRAVEFQARFIIYATGIFSHTETRDDVHNPGLSAFNGRIVHPQFWPADLDYEAKRILLIASGATVITLLSELSQTTLHVTMIQRSPAYLISLPGTQYDFSSRWLTGCLPDIVFPKKRYLWLWAVRAVYVLCLWFPRVMRWILISLVRL